MKTSTLKGYLWIATGIVIFFLIGFLGQNSLHERQHWPLYTAQVTSTKISWAQHMSDEYALTINLNITSEDKLSYSASMQQAGPKGALEKRVDSDFRTGQQLKVRVNPELPSHVVLDIKPGWGAWIVALIVFILFFANGMAVLNQSRASR